MADGSWLMAHSLWFVADGLWFFDGVDQGADAFAELDGGRFYAGEFRVAYPGPAGEISKSVTVSNNEPLAI